MVGVAVKPRRRARPRPLARSLIPAATLFSVAICLIFQLRYLGVFLSEQAPTLVPLGVPKNNVNATYPLRLLKGHHPRSYDGTSLQRNRTLVVVWGSVRSTEVAWQSLYREVLDVHSADLALIAQRNPSNDLESTSLYSRAAYVWEYNTFAKWGDAVDLVGRSKDEGKTWRDFARRTQVALGGTDVQPKGSGAIIFLHRWFASNCLEELLGYYDTFVFTRSDHAYFCPDPVGVMRNGSIWIPVGEDWGGIPDRHLVVGRDDVMKVLNVLPPIVEHPAKHIEMLKGANKIVEQGWRGGIRNSETLLKLSWVREGIWDKVRRYPRNMVVTTTLKQNNVGWAKPAPPNGTAAGLFFKYPAEYNEVKDNGCRIEGSERYGVRVGTLRVCGSTGRGLCTPRVYNIPNWMEEEQGLRPYHCEECKKHKLGCLEACSA